MFPLYQTSGFYRAPVSKALVCGSALASLAFTFPLNQFHPWFAFSYQMPITNTQVLKFLACRCIFLDPKDIMCAGVLLYHFRIFERRFGSLKFASYILCNFCVSIALEMGLWYLCQHLDFKFHTVPSGPYGVVFSLYICYFCDIPRVAYTHVMGVPVTGKSLTYIIGLQLLSGSLESSILALIGLCSGLLVKFNILWIRKWFSFPKFIGTISHATLGWILDTPKPRDPATPIGATLELQRQQHMEQLEHQMAWAQLQPRQGGLGGFGFNLFGGGPAQPNGDLEFDMPQNNPAPPPQPPADDQIQRLVEMGFNRDNVMNALRVSNNDINVATNILLHEG